MTDQVGREPHRDGERLPREVRIADVGQGAESACEAAGGRAAFGEDSEV
jgi:hypothetical protein